MSRLISLGRILRNEDVSVDDRVIKSLQELAEVVEYLRQSGYKITATTGVWDLLHVGHCRYLNETRKLGSICIAEVDSDEVVRRRKPDNIHRPIVPMGERTEMLSWARLVDLMYSLLDGEDPVEFIRVMRPDVFVVSETSEDSKEEYLSQIRDHCGEVVILQAQAQISTTERIRRMMMVGAIDKLIELREMIDGMISDLGGESTKDKGGN